MPILHKKSKKKKQRQKDVELSNRGVSTFNVPTLDSNGGLHDGLSNHVGQYKAPILYEPRDHAFDYFPLSYKNNPTVAFAQTSPDKKEGKPSRRWKLSPMFKLKECGVDPNHASSATKSGGGDSSLLAPEASTSTLRQEVLRHVIARRTLEGEKAELTRHMAQKDSLICDMRKQMIQKEKSFHMQRTQFEEAIRNIQNGKPFRPFRGESPGGRTQGGREELQLVREAIGALRGNFRGTDPNQHTLDTLEQAISVLMERGSLNAGGDLINGGGNVNKEKRSTNAQCDSYTKVIYFTDRTVTPFMSNISKKLGEVTLRDFKNLFDRPGCFRFHFKSHDPEYGLVKEEVMNDDDILPGVDGKIIAWVEEDIE